MRNLHKLAGSLMAAMGSLGAVQAEGAAKAVVENEFTLTQMAAGFVALAGCHENALALVASLREGLAVQLAYPGATADSLPKLVAIEPPTGPMDWSDVRMSLMLARDALTGFGVLRPSGEQLQAALTGGEVAVPGARTVAFRGVLRMRAEGASWGRIASERFQRRAVSRIE